MNTSDDDSGEPSVETVLDRLLRAVFMAIRARFASEVSKEVIDRMARQILNEFQESTEVAWESAEPVTVAKAKRVAMLMRPVRLAGHVADLRDPQVVLAPDGRGGFTQVETTCARMEDREGMSMWSLDVAGESIIDKLRATRGRFSEFLGIVIALPTTLDAKRPDAGVGAMDFLLHVVDVRQTTSAFDLLAAPADERTRGRELLLDLRRQNLSPLKSIAATLTERLHVVGLDKVPILGDLIEFAVLQAVSDGWISHAPAKLHLLLIGPPARGKKLLQLVAQILNPVAGTLSSARASPAGWVGASSHHDGRWTSAPGVLPRASGGVALLQDAHTISAAELRKLVHILAEVIEDGRVRSSVAGGSEWDASAGLMIDMNTDEQAWGHVATTRPSLLHSRPLLSRLDVIISLPRNDALAWEVAEEMYTTGTRSTHLEDEPWVRDQKLLIAALRDEHPHVDLAPVQQVARDVHRSLAKDDHFGGLPNAGDFATRLSISFQRLLAASARANDRSAAVFEDVRRAAAFLLKKLDFLKGLAAQAPRSAVDFDSWLEQFAGQEVNPTTLADDYEAATGVAVSQRTVRRHLQTLATATGHGRYRLPPKRKT